jgi:hypothetical protein
MAEEEPPSVSGALACGLRDVVLELVGKPQIEVALDRVSASHRRRYEGMLPVGWVPIETMEVVFSAIAAELGTTLSDLHTRVARVSIERTMRTLWRMLLRVTTDNALVSRTPTIFARSYNRGRLQAAIPTQGRAEIILVAWPNAPEWPLRATRIGVETVLRLAGRKSVRVTYDRTDDGAAYVATFH